MRKIFPTDKFREEFDSFDNSVKLILVKGISKIQEKPELGKPLKGPLAGFFSEHVWKVRITYKFDSEAVYLYRCKWRKEGY